MKVRVINQPLPYSVKRHKVGETLEMSDSDARILIALDRVEEFVPPKKVEKVVVSEEVEEVEEEKPKRKKRTYKRRDITAET